MSTWEYDTEFESLLVDSPLVNPEILRDVRNLIRAAEYGVAFETICSWIHEDSLAITPEYYERLSRISGTMGDEAAVEQLRSLVSGP